MIAIRFGEALIATQAILNQNPSLEKAGVTQVEAALLVAWAAETHLGKRLSRPEVFLMSHEPFPQEAWEKLKAGAKSRKEGIPLQHIFGVQTFLHHEYRVSPDVLIPRPETELLVVEVIEYFRKRNKQPLLGLEVGLGSGVISIELLSEFSDLRMLASEVSPDAIEVAKENAEAILGKKIWGKERFEARLEILGVDEAHHVLEPFWLPGLVDDAAKKADFLVSNPPYLVPSDEIGHDVLHHEPHLALFSPAEDPIYFYRKIAEKAHECLSPSGVVFLEIATERSGKLQEAFEETGGWSVEIRPDLTGRDRILVAERVMPEQEG
jgi:release factor glutamine methyltransferase